MNEFAHMIDAAGTSDFWKCAGGLARGVEAFSHDLVSERPLA